MFTKTDHHPSNTLYRGECRDVRHALELMVQQYEHEATMCSGDPDQDDLAPMMTEAANKARKMLAEYDRAVKSVVDDLIGKWASSEDRDVSDWAVHLDVGAFENLAV